ncbi:hypothetical protein RRF57_012537 [Xylaria bambusicola]|uniref:Uncharacterized protein n=1 Tax=Xylaria bambusicola TaxID=326684 RepID=A0AAN7UPR4_9PEZI
MIDRGLGDQAQGRLADPLPKDNVFVHGGGLELLLLLEIEYLQRSRLGTESDDLLSPVHDGTIGLDRATGDIVIGLEINNDDVGLSGTWFLVSYANEVVRF